MRDLPMNALRRQDAFPAAGRYPHQACRRRPTPEPEHYNNLATLADSNESGPRFR
jgi:hypothetical protein